MKSFESPMERIMMYEINKEHLNKHKEFCEEYSDSCMTKIVKYAKKVKKRILKK